MSSSVIRMPASRAAATRASPIAFGVGVRNAVGRVVQVVELADRRDPRQRHLPVRRSGEPEVVLGVERGGDVVHLPPPGPERTAVSMGPAAQRPVERVAMGVGEGRAASGRAAAPRPRAAPARRGARCGCARRRPRPRRWQPPARRPTTPARSGSSSPAVTPPFAPRGPSRSGPNHGPSPAAAFSAIRSGRVVAGIDTAVAGWLSPYLSSACGHVAHAERCERRQVGARRGAPDEAAGGERAHQDDTDARAPGPGAGCAARRRARAGCTAPGSPRRARCA